MSHSLDKLLLRVAEGIFEGLAFMLTMLEDEATDLPSGAAVAAVDFEGPFQGRLLISLADQMLPELATNMLGLEEQASPTLLQQHDALKELANVVCGNLLPEIAGSEAEFNVSAPFLASNDFPGLPPSDQRLAAKARLILDSGEVNLALFLQNNALTEKLALFTGSSQSSQ